MIFAACRPSSESKRQTTAMTVDEKWNAFVTEIENTPESLKVRKVLSVASKNINNELGYRILTTVILPERELQLRLLGNLSDSMQSRPEARQMMYMLRSQNGRRLSNFNMETLDDRWIQVYDEIKRHDITIIDFWASWCRPCRESMPLLVAVYDKYKSKGLGIIGISLDENRDAWAQAVEQLGMTWLQMSDLKGWDNLAARTNKVRAIPHSIIVDKKGYILAEGLPMTQIDSFLSERLK